MGTRTSSNNTPAHRNVDGRQSAYGGGRWAGTGAAAAGSASSACPSPCQQAPPVQRAHTLRDVVVVTPNGWELPEAHSSARQLPARPSVCATPRLWTGNVRLALAQGVDDAEAAELDGRASALSGDTPRWLASPSPTGTAGGEGSGSPGEAHAREAGAPAVNECAALEGAAHAGDQARAQAAPAQAPGHDTRTVAPGGLCDAAIDETAHEPDVGLSQLTRAVVVDDVKVRPTPCRMRARGLDGRHWCIATGWPCPVL
jgi:hypothetical protein